MTVFEPLDRFRAVAGLVADVPAVLLFEQASQVATDRRIIIRQ